MKTLDNGDTEIIAILGRLQIFWGFESRPVLLARSRRLAGEKWTKLKNLLSRVYYLHEDYELRIILTRNSFTAKFYGEERRMLAPYISEFTFTSTKRKKKLQIQLGNTTTGIGCCHVTDVALFSSRLPAEHSVFAGCTWNRGLVAKSVNFRLRSRPIHDGFGFAIDFALCGERCTG